MNTTPVSSIALLFAATSILLPALALLCISLAGKRLRHATSYLILLLCVIRILIPTGWAGPTLFRFSVHTDWSNGQAVAPPVSNVDSATEEERPNQLDPSVKLPASPSGGGAQSDPNDPNPIRTASDFFVRHYDAVLLLAWAVGALATACVMIAPQMRLLGREMRFRTPTPERTATAYAEVCRLMNVKHPPALCCLDLAVSPHLCGLIRPSIRLGNTPLSERELCYMLRHELMHHRRGDLAAKLVLTAALAIFWWNPLVGLLVKRAQEELELACDEAVLSNASEQERCEYGGAILKILRNSRRAQSPLPSALSASGNATVTRFREITSTAKRGRGIVFILIFVLMLIGSGAILGYGVAAESEEPAPPEDVTNVFFLKGDCNLTERQLLDISKSLEIPPHEGLHMVGWNVYSDKAANGSYSFRFEAVLHPNQYRIRLYANGGNVKNDDTLRDFDSALPTPTREGYTFGGWYTDVSLTEPIERVPARSVSLYAAWLEETPTNDFLFTERNGAIVILSYRGEASALVIPAYVGGKPVTSLAVGAFSHETELGSVTLPETVTQIGAGAFRYCYSLHTLTLYGEVSYLDRSVLEACYALEQVNCPASVQSTLAPQLPASVTLSPLSRS